MHWYGGSIAEAVALSKQKNAIFVVFVEGNNDLSTEMAATIDDEAVLCRLGNQDNFLAVKLKSGTANYTHFAQIYQFVPVPSLFFIGRNGTPLEVVCAGVQASNLASRIDRILAEHHAGKLPAVQPSTSSESLKEQTVNLIQAESSSSSAPEALAPPQPKAEPPVSRKLESVSPEPSSPPAKIQKTADATAPASDIVCDGDVCVRRPREDGASTSSQGQTAATTATHTTEESKPLSPTTEVTSSTSSIEEKMDRAKELIEARRREKEEKEKELERQKELERRNAGQGVAELKRWQAEQEMKQIQEERKREKMENNLARQRILEQIAQDRAERRARDSPATPTTHTPAPTTATPAPPATSGDSHGSARIQFKLPDGTSHTASFDAAGTLRRVHEYVADNLQLSTSNFTLWTAFPRRELVETDCTLTELQLAPSAALLVLPRRGATAPPRDSSFSIVAFVTQLLSSLIYEPTIQLYTWLRARLFPPPAVSPRAPPAAPPRPPTAAPLRRRGNIHRLPGDAPDDDNNTWNGNSTQQM